MFSSVYGPWTLFTDLGLIFALLLVGKLIRVKVKFIQKLFIPPSLIAGFLGLAMGPNGLGWLPFSNQLGTYAGVLIALVFAALPLSSPKFRFKEVAGRVGPIWAYAQLGMLLQWAFMGLFGLFVLNIIWPQLNSAFGIMLPTGFYGGHGTAAAIGDAFGSLGWEEAKSLGMTTATAGVVIAIVVGLVMVKRAAVKGDTSFISDFSDLPDELRTGLIPEGNREDAGTSTTSSISIDSLAFHLAFVFVVALIGYLFSQGVKSYYPKLEIPVFSASFIVGLVFKKIFDSTGVSEYICPRQTSRLSSTFTDLLVACGVASIQLSVVVKYAVPLVILIAVGAFVVWAVTFFLGRRLCKTFWFERSIFAWGWWTGTMAMGIALIRIVDPKLESKAMDDYAMAYLPIAPVEILIITFVPVLFVNGLGLWLLLGLLLLSFLIVLFAKRMGWWIKPVKNTKP
ncbi:MAG: sodium/glutamate symporter [Bacteroidales bacterium]|nr:sodium/glutamate symporter [Bacteroidales bacterium]MDD3844171.1 sodium/glutamate symporter [Bacteroidales bacterium]MDD4618563.1 sodium/glutamate symporter [Bacteroidales bacterium]